MLVVLPVPGGPCNARKESCDKLNVMPNWCLYLSPARRRSHCVAPATAGSDLRKKRPAPRAKAESKEAPRSMRKSGVERSAPLHAQSGLCVLSWQKQAINCKKEVGSDLLPGGENARYCSPQKATSYLSEKHTTHREDQVGHVSLNCDAGQAGDGVAVAHYVAELRRKEAAQSGW